MATRRHTTRNPRPLAGPRRCDRCRVPKDPAEFVLWTDPATLAARHATRGWCAPCLLAAGHLTAAQVRRLRQPAPARWSTVETRLANRDRYVNELLTRADDPDFAEALRTAARWIATHPDS